MKHAHLPYQYFGYVGLRLYAFIFLTLCLASCSGINTSTNGHTSMADSLNKQAIVAEALRKDSALAIQVNGIKPINIFQEGLVQATREIDSLHKEIDSLVVYKASKSVHKIDIDSIIEEKQSNMRRLSVRQDDFTRLYEKYKIEGCEATKIKSKEGRSFSCYFANPANVHLFWADSTGRPYGSFSDYNAKLQTEGKVLAFATNGGMYMPDQSPQGLYVENGKLLKALDTLQNKSGNFYMQPNGVFFMTKSNRAYVVVSKDYKMYQDSAQYATQSGPMLLIDGKINDKFDIASSNFHIRSGVGINAEGKAVFIISDVRVRFYELAQAFLDLGCKNALYLDGAISQTYLPELGMNSTGGGFGVMIGVVK